MRDISNAQVTLAKGKKRIFDALKAGLSLTRDGLEASGFYWHLVPKLSRLPDQVAFGFTSEHASKLRFFQTLKISENMNNFGILPKTVKGTPMRRLKASNINMVQVIQNLDLSEQRALLNDILSNYEIFESRIWSQQYFLDFRELENSTDNPASFQQTLDRSLQHNSSISPKEHRVNLAPIWIALFLFSEGHATWSSADTLEGSHYLRNGFNPFRGFIFFHLLAADRHPLLSHAIKATRSISKDVPQLTLRSLLLTPDFLKSANPQEFYQSLFEFKKTKNATEVNKKHNYSLLNRIHSEIGHFFSVPPNEVVHGDYFGGSARLNSAYSGGLFSWVISPETSKYRTFEKLAGFPCPKAFPEELKHWAMMFREIAPKLKRKTLETYKRSVHLWLIYLLKLKNEEGEEFPRDFSELDRNLHIKLGSPSFTFMQFLTTTPLSSGVKEQAIRDLEKAIKLADSMYNLDLPAFPISRSIDTFGHKYVKHAKTVRDSIPRELYDFILAENRKDDFAFARSLRHSRLGSPLYCRSVFDPSVEMRRNIFFPAVPTLLDFILTSGARSSDARHIDSGEGDGYLVNHKGESDENQLLIASTDRQEGVLRSFAAPTISDGRDVLGLHFIDSKTGPYQVPYIDPETAKFLEAMREWQIRYFPITGPLKIMKNREVQGGNADMFLETYPLFRDPKNKGRIKTVSAGMLDSYWHNLLVHCENLYLEKTGRKGAFLVDGAPRWNIHAIRVTNITVWLEKGLSPQIVASLVGHKSILMTFYYDSPNTTDVVNAINETHRHFGRKVRQSLESDDRPEQVAAQIFEAIGNTSLETEDANIALRELVKRRLSPDIFAHGICPGADCSAHPTTPQSQHANVFRPRACSSCRFRITGPAFLSGLVWRYNSLIAECKVSISSEQKIRAKSEEFEQNGEQHRAYKLRLEAERLERERDHLFKEVTTEFWTIVKCLQIKNKEQGALVIRDQAPLKLIHKEVNDFTLFQNVISGASLHFDADHEVPDSIVMRRNEILKKIARQNNMEELFFKLTDQENCEAMNSLCSLISESPYVEQLITGEYKITDLPTLKSQFDQMHTMLERPSLFGGANNDA
ncbi:VPA1269 family protein [Kordiimonas lipolytica]|uniref:VPA1269 family protein n=1 Tax=Kordiimonas lipolytica TaxID=1662421 RepID=UPI001E5CD624|nr:VPA1269 family protein [Kordiimonas lipolytica]